MVFDFAAMPPEVNSALMYAGVGSGPMMAASATWNNLASELSTTAAQYESIVSTLTTEHWRGAGSTSAAAAAQPYIEWLTSTAAAAEQAGAQAAASAAAYEAAFAATVSPAVVAANRSLLMALTASNILGINTPAILATEAHYSEMWVQDATAMHAYSAAATSSAALQPLKPSGQTANSASASAAQGGLQGFFNDLVNDWNNGLPAGDTWWSSVAGTGFGNLAEAWTNAFGTNFVFNAVQQVGVTAAWFVGNGIPTAVSYIHTIATSPIGAIGAAVGNVTPASGAALAAPSTLVSSTAPSAGLGGASTVGKLTVPSSWSSAVPETSPTGTTAIEGSGWTPGTAQGEAGGPVIGGPGGAGFGRGAGSQAGPRYGVKPIVMPKQVVV